MKHIVRYSNLNLLLCSFLSELSSKKNRGRARLWGEIFSRAINNYLQRETFINQKLKKNLSQKQIYFSITFCADQKMKKLNNQYRYKNKTTDVLSFYLHHNFYQKNTVNLPEINLGDIFISYPQAKKQSQHFFISVEDEVFHLMAHGFLHLLGLDHERSKKEDQTMREEEQKLIRIISLEKAKGKKNGRWFKTKN